MSEVMKLYEASGNVIRKLPVETKIEGGSRFTLGFPVCTLSEYTEDQGEAVAELLNRGEAYEALSKKSWRCFHCDENFTSEHEARLHFGATEDSTPACRIAGAEHSLLQELRRVENELSDLWFSVHNESTEAAKAYFSQNGRHQRQLVVAEELGYERGLRDARVEDVSLLECLKDARRLLTDQDAIDLEYLDSVIARAEGSVA